MLEGQHWNRHQLKLPFQESNDMEGAEHSQKLWHPTVTEKIIQYENLQDVSKHIV
jgi:hypothetical protein